MDVFTHALVGAASGAVFGEPVAGAVIATLPDLPLLGPRRDRPTAPYLWSHSLLFVGLCTLLVWPFGYGAVAALALLSHLAIDIPTHGEHFSPRLLFPNRKRLFYFDEWEFFNRSWCLGLIVSIIWSTICLSVAPLS